jgi:hypothetical protein
MEGVNRTIVNRILTIVAFKTLVVVDGCRADWSRRLHGLSQIVRVAVMQLLKTYEVLLEERYIVVDRTVLKSVGRFADHARAIADIRVGFELVDSDCVGVVNLATGGIRRDIDVENVVDQRCDFRVGGVISRDRRSIGSRSNKVLKQACFNPLDVIRSVVTLVIDDSR